MKHTNGSTRRLQRWGNSRLLRMFAILSLLGLMHVTGGLAASQAAETTSPTVSQTDTSQPDSTGSSTKTKVSKDNYKVKKDGVTFEVTEKTITRTSYGPSEVENGTMPDKTQKGSTDSRAPPTSSEPNPKDCVNAGEMSPTRVELVACSYSSTSLDATASAVSRSLIEGATQLTWWYPNHNVKVSDKAIKHAPWVKVKYTRCAKQSKSIAKQANGASVVIAKLGSKICNTGKLGHIVGGFPWTVQKGPAVLKWNKKLHLYEHLFNLIVPNEVRPDDTVVGYVTVHGTRYAIVKVCKNRMGGHVDKMFDSVVQVRNEGDVIDEATVTGKDSGTVSVQGTLQCPAGTLWGSATVNTFTEVTIMVRAKASTILKAIEIAEGVVKTEASSKAKGDASAQSMALAAITLECSENPPTYDECPNIPGDQPPGYQCYPPTTNNPPSGEIVQFPEHMYVTVDQNNPSVYRAKVVGGDPEDGGNVTLNYQVTGAAFVFSDANHPTICDVEGSQRICTFWIKSGSTAGNATLTLTVTDSKGTPSPQYSKTWPIVADQF